MKRFAVGEACGETFVNFVLFNGSQSLVRILSQMGRTVKVHHSDINDGSGAMLEQASDAHITSQAREGGRSGRRGDSGGWVRGKGKVGGGRGGGWCRGSLKGWRGSSSVHSCVHVHC